MTTVKVIDMDYGRAIVIIGKAVAMGHDAFVNGMMRHVGTEPRMVRRMARGLFRVLQGAPSLDSRAYSGFVMHLASMVLDYFPELGRGT